MDNEERRKELKRKLNDKIKQKEILRSSKDQKEKNIINDDLKNLGINNMNELKEYMKSLKDMNIDEVIKNLKSNGLSEDQIKNFFKIMKNK